MKFTYKLILPKPDMIILLYGDPITLSHRKPNEVSIISAKRGLEKWEKVSDNILSKNVIKINTTNKGITESALYIQNLLRENKNIKNNLFNSLK